MIITGLKNKNLMNKMECNFCKNIFSNKQNLNYHQTRAKYCLKIQGVSAKIIDTCNICLKTFSINANYKRHAKNCKPTNLSNKLEIALKKINTIENNYNILKKENEILRSDKKNLQDRYDKLSLTAVRRPTSSTKNVQINNYIQNMAPLRLEDIKESIPQLTLEHHVKGAEGYAEYALEFPFKDKIVCVDVTRNKIKYKNDDGDVIEDIGFRKMMTKLCESLKDRSFNLCQEHYEKLSKKFTEKEMDEYNFMETALAITKYANGRENEFCNKVIRLISKGSKH
jgi:hypothetical protein